MCRKNDRAECGHFEVACINQHEIIRKYKCSKCHEVMMCECDQSLGEKFFPHQIDRGVYAKTQERVPVSIGFVSGVCDACRGKPEVPHPRAETYGCKTKIQRYYWREIIRRACELYEAWGGNPARYIFEPIDEVDSLASRARKAAIEEIKEVHERSPKYIIHEESNSQFIARMQIDVVEMYADYGRVTDGARQIRTDSGEVDIEEFARMKFEDEGWQMIISESRPFQLLFAVLLWPLIQDGNDPKVSLVGFGERNACEQDCSVNTIHTMLPSDFGTHGYWERRQAEIAAHFKILRTADDAISVLFAEWFAPSYGLRQYLWVHTLECSKRAAWIVEKFSPADIIKILECMLRCYWESYLGWPDLVGVRGGQVKFVEVKSRKDKLAQDQRKWMELNAKWLKFECCIAKVLPRD